MSYLFDRESSDEAVLHGQFGCYTCYDVVDRATLNKETSHLEYICSEGHENSVPWGDPEEVVVDE